MAVQTARNRVANNIRTKEKRGFHRTTSVSIGSFFLMMKPCTITTAQLQVKKVSLRDGFDL